MRVFQGFLIALGVLCVLPVAAQSLLPGYPKKPIRVLVGTPAGSGSDVMTRAVAQKLSERLGQSVVVDNRAGASGAISLQMGAQATPDGYTLVTLSAQNVTAMLLGTVSTDISKELAPVCMLLSQPYMLVANPSLEANTVKELISLAKSKPLVYASSGVGTVVHLGMELFKAMAAVEMTHVPYKGSGLSMIDLMGVNVTTPPMSCRPPNHHLPFTHQSTNRRPPALEYPNREVATGCETRCSRVQYVHS